MSAKAEISASLAEQSNETKDEVDFVRTNNCNNNYNAKQQQCNENVPKNIVKNNDKVENPPIPMPMPATTTKTNEQKKNTTKERLSLFSFSRKLSQKHQHHQQQQKINGANIKNTNSNSNNNYINQETNGHLALNSEKTDFTTTTMTTTTTTTTTTAMVPHSFACQAPIIPIGTPPRQHKFVKGPSSFARLFSSTYNAKKFEKEEQKRIANGGGGKFHTYGGRRRAGPYYERFKKALREDYDADAAMAVIEKTEDIAGKNNAKLSRKKKRSSNSCSELATLDPDDDGQRNEDLGFKALRTLSRGIGRLWFKRSHSVDISTPDPEFKVAYLGNVLTGWAKGEGCVEKQLATLWRNYTQNNKPDVIMRIKVCASGLKATTRQHGLTEYWANRITHCCAPKNYPRVFCWIYRHEGRKLKHELRCHAVLCSKEKIVHEICDTLKENLECALREFKREKLLKQNARLSLANAAYDNPSLPRRKILLSVGGNNYRPPLERSKSAPKLMAIEEAIGEEDGDEVEDTNEPEMMPCCQRDSLYPAMTLGRRHCRRGHSIRRTGKARPSCGGGGTQLECCHEQVLDCKSAIESARDSASATAQAEEQQQQRNSYGSNDSDDFEKLLKHNDYDSNASLAKELLPYFDMQLTKNKSSSLSSLNKLNDVDADADVDGCDAEPLSLLPTINTDPNADPIADVVPVAELEFSAAHSEVVHIDTDDDDDEAVIVGLRRRPGICSDGEEDDYLDADDAELRYFRRQSILNILHRNSMRKMAQISLSSDENSSLEIEHKTTIPVAQYHRHQLQSSISSNASSTGTTEEGSSSVSSADHRDDSREQTSKQFQADSDEGSLSSGCETASTVTTPIHEDLSSLQSYTHPQMMHEMHILNGIPLSSNDDISSNGGESSPITVEEIYQRLEARLNGQRHNSSDGTTTFSSSSSITLKLSNSPDTSMHDLMNENGMENGANKMTSGHVARAVRRLRRSQREHLESESDEYSDESGYVEFQERDKRNSKVDQRNKSANHQTQTTAITTQRPKTPPKPMPRRHITSGGTGTAV